MPHEALRLLLAHEPDVADEVAHHGVALQLSGHTHGGQIRHPKRGALVLPRLGRRYPHGLYRVPDSQTWVYTSRGVGTSGYHLRVNCHPEVAVLTLVLGR